MTLAGWIFMISSMAAVLMLVIACYVRILRRRTD